MKTARRRAREFVVQGIYQWTLNPEQTAAQIEHHLQENDLFKKADAPLFQTLLHGVLKDNLLLTEQLSPYYDRDHAQISPIERAVLLMAALELTQHPETPYPVILNEAIEITKTFGGIDGHKFVNGVLDKLASHTRADEVQAFQAKRQPRARNHSTTR